MSEQDAGPQQDGQQPTGQQPTGQWVTYPAWVEDAPASFLVRADLQQERPAFEAFYLVALQLLDPGEHGMGEASDAETLWQLEDELEPPIAQLGLVYVGRVRNLGEWRLCFYGEPGRQEALTSLLESALQGARRDFRVSEREDSSWSVYEQFLLPDAERWQWIQDAQQLQALEEHGDRHERARPIDHTLYFPSDAQRDACATAAARLGFRPQLLEAQPDYEHPYGLDLTREDPVELEHIHDVVMQLSELAEGHGGQYDGWGCEVVSD